MNLHEKLFEIHKGIKGFAKDATNNFHKFDFVSSNKVISNIRALMQENKVLLMPDILETKLNIIDVTDGKPQFFTELWIAFRWVNVEDPKDFIDRKFYAQGKDGAELGAGKAATYAEKYFLLKFFQIPTDSDDPDGGGKAKPAVKGNTRRTDIPPADGPPPNDIPLPDPPEMFTAPASGGMECPKCGAPMKARRGKDGPFYGCSTYPDCKGTRPA